jgi:hypothetical protein
MDLHHMPVCHTLTTPSCVCDPISKPKLHNDWGTPTFEDEGPRPTFADLYHPGELLCDPFAVYVTDLKITGIYHTFSNTARAGPRTNNR